jgi:rare lipoprotein A
MIRRRLMLLVVSVLGIMPAASPDPVGRGVSLAALRLKTQPVFALSSWYGPGFHGRTQANGRPFNQWALTCASRHFKLGRKLLAFNPETKKKVVLTVTDRGPYVGHRSLDVSTRAAEVLGFKRKGVTTLVLRPLPDGLQGVQEAWAL